MIDIASIARSWIGTPFFPKMASKGVGADCVTMMLAIYQEATLLPAGIVFPQYTLAQGDHLAESTVLKWLQQTQWFTPAQEPLAVGDLLTFTIGKVVHHTGIVVSDFSFVHSIRGYGAIESLLRDSTWQSRFAGAWRLRAMGGVK